MVHEIGHCLGFRHSDNPFAEHDPENVGAVQIPGTPTFDGNSVMNSTVGGLSGWPGFSQFDIVGLQNLYPNIVPVGRVIWLKGSNDLYVSSNVENVYQQPNPGYMKSDRPEIGPWERFTAVDAGNGQVALFK